MLYQYRSIMKREYMTVSVKDNKVYRYEGVWRNTKKVQPSDYDDNNREIPWPEEYKGVWSKNIFIKKLKEVESELILKGKFISYGKNEARDCVFGDYSDVSNKLFYLGNNYWEDGLLHYVMKHKVRPSNEFIDMIMNLDIKQGRSKKGKEILHIPAVSMVKYGKKYLKITKNQMLIMDALLKHGSYTKKYQDRKKKEMFRFSEHSGLLDFHKNGLDKIIVSGKTYRVDEHDDDIFLPENMIESYDFEYFFHTHPLTPKPGGRADTGILYEFPSGSDIFHFIEHYNRGVTQGSIIIAAEGMYIIRKNIVDDTKIEIEDEDKAYDEIVDYMNSLQDKALRKYGYKFDSHTFYSKIAQDLNYIKLLNKKLAKYEIYIDYKPREQDSKGRWIIGSVYLPVYVIEPK